MAPKESLRLPVIRALSLRRRPVAPDYLWETWGPGVTGPAVKEVGPLPLSCELGYQDTLLRAIPLLCVSASERLV